MKKYKILLIVLIIVIIGVSFYFIFNNKKEKSIPIKEKTDITEVGQEAEKIISDTKSIEKVEAEIEKLNKEEPLPEGNERFIVALNYTNEKIADNLAQAGFITDTSSFLIKLNKSKNSIVAGGYKLSKEMTTDQIDKVLHNNPYMKWVVIKPGLRKEEIADILTKALNWNSKTKNDWVTKYTNTNSDYKEGVYYPDTYLIPIDESPEQVTKRLINKFNENFSAYQLQFTAKNIKWTKALILASIVQREASNNADMPLIAGILWNRLNQDMYLGVDATLQYARGNTSSGWWAPINISDKQNNSPYNTYKYKGLPPTPISNPSMYAFEAVLNPTKTDCLYYIHDKSKITHCSTTYEEHQQNIQKYLIGTNTD